jgi:hypothetical protein
MLHFYTGTDRTKARAKLNADVEKRSKKNVSVVRITDTHTVDDLHAALRGGGMFVEKQVIVLDGILSNEELREILVQNLKYIRDSSDDFFLLQEKPDAATRKLIEKYAEQSEKFDAPKKADRGGSIFALANALRLGDKKALWVGYQRELQTNAAEALHGVLFWGAKQSLQYAKSSVEIARAQKIVADLAELPHEARRRGQELEYALEHFVLTNV